MTDKMIADRQQRVIDNLHDEDFNTVKHWEGMELFNVLNDEQKAPFFESVASLVRSAIVARKTEEERIERMKNMANVSRILFVYSVCSYTWF
jgi:Mg/Co/Ni transporter MgtE